MQHAAPETASDLEQERHSVEPQADGDGHSADDIAGEAIVDDRISGLPPNHSEPSPDVEPVDSPELDAEIPADLEKEGQE